MVRDAVIVSGKGGIGKTSIVASFAALADKAVLADCVVAADLHLVRCRAIAVDSELVSSEPRRSIQCR